MDNYIETGMLVIMTTLYLASFINISIALTLIIAFITDTIPQMPKMLRWIQLMDEDQYVTKALPHPINVMTLLQTMLLGLLITLGSLFLWPLYIAIALMYTTRGAYRHREGIMKFLRVMTNVHVTAPVEEKPLEGLETEEPGQHKGTPSKEWKYLYVEGEEQTVIGENSVEEPRWARPPPSEETKL